MEKENKEHRQLLDLEIRQGKGMLVYLEKVLHKFFAFFFVCTCLVIVFSYVGHQNNLNQPVLYLYWSAIALLLVSFLLVIVGSVACHNARKVLEKKKKEYEQFKEYDAA